MELHNLYSSPNIIRVIKSRRVGYVRHVARMGEVKNLCNSLVDIDLPKWMALRGKPSRR
jgi:hypothetical protein